MITSRTLFPMIVQIDLQHCVAERDIDHSHIMTMIRDNQNYCQLNEQPAKLKDRLAALNISSIPTSVETSVTDTIGVAPNIQQ